MMRNSWTLKERLQYILARRLLKKIKIKIKKDDNEMKEKSPKVMNTL